MIQKAVANRILNRGPFRFLIFTCVAIILTLAASSRAVDRFEADRQAKAKFLQTNFFADGRGIHDSPGQFYRAKTMFGIMIWNSLQDTLTPWAQIINKPAMKMMSRTSGLNVVNNRFVGLFEEKYSNIPTGVLGCVACHSGKAAGIFIPGLGNKGIDNAAAQGWSASIIGNIEMTVSAFSRRGYDPIVSQMLTESAQRMLRIQSDLSFVSPTQGLIEDNVVYRTFFESFGRYYPSGEKSYLNKIPHLWGIGEKRKIGKFWDGAGDGKAPGWTVAVEIMNGQTAETIRKPEYLKKIKETEDLMADFLPPSYPFHIDRPAANRGKTIFNSLCIKCHGSYEKDTNGLPIYQAPKLIRVSIVGTDPSRSEFFRDPEFWKAAESSSFKGLISMSPNYDIKQARYFAPRLEGIWSRFPYLHNGSVLSLWALLNPEQRSKVFSIRDAGEEFRFDKDRVGLTSPSSLLEISVLQLRAEQKAKDVYYTLRPGHSNQGHPFGANFTAPQKMDLIEYLKSL